MDAPDGLAERLRRVAARLRRLERREVRDLRAWLEHTNNLIHLSILVFVPLLVAAVSYLADRFAIQEVSFFLFPPLASATYTLFSDPEGRFASPWRFVGGLTMGALVGYATVQVGARVQGVTPAAVEVTALWAALSVFLAAATTWALDLEEPAAFSTALLTLVTRTTQEAYVVSVFLSSAFVTGVFVLWRRHLFEERARYLYSSIEGGDRVLVPWRGDYPLATAHLGAALTAGHEGSKVVLLGTVDEDAVTEFDVPVGVEGRPLSDGGTPDDGTTVEGHEGDTALSATRLERVAADLQRRYGVPTEVVLVSAADGRASAATVLDVVADTNCDLVVTGYETADGTLTRFVGDLFRSETDVLVHRSVDGRTEWRDVLVPVRKAGEVAHRMIEFATRFARDGGRVSVVHCIGSSRERSGASRMLSNLVETVGREVETHIAALPIESYLARVAGEYDLVVVGSSGDRSTASRLVSRPTFERLETVECDVAILDRNG
jgi:nucleotide-binding universal stress UspA family protein